MSLGALHFSDYEQKKLEEHFQKTHHDYYQYVVLTNEFQAKLKI